ncbi:MAG: tRNA pseudouridine(38-40) synthase TruA [Bdellovibrio sp.]|nr:tRNA pseudouridine(38-40) synthase TruA [Bdellovibrio sp.]
MEKIKRKYAAWVSYAGTSFCGWQTQKQKDLLPSIQTTLEMALLKMTGQQIRVIGSGRTDSGVHAAGQVAHFIIDDRDWDERVLQRGLNGILPRTIRIVQVKSVPLDFHAQKSAIKKQYSYYFQQGPCALPHLEPYTWWISKKLDLDAMREGLRYLEGEHDFKAFQAAGAKPGPTVRSILETEVAFLSPGFPPSLATPFGLVRVRVIGSGFLKQMVRGIAGTLLQVGEGRRPAKDFKLILDSLDRKSVGPTAPARALWLEKVWYPENVGLWDNPGEGKLDGK